MNNIYLPEYTITKFFEELPEKTLISHTTSIKVKNNKCKITYTIKIIP